ncbi:2-oxoacid dehydrogenases acyltransferase-domain-containing protein [Jimgerdemannia flammicorona]|uniref:Dihydrolipoamide acetyltransferase component of pyruvate dehydrogenase complex n=1 Tax=Jimgerdemannia flammicorona TaxID=994334 RepID=A0A433Q2N7_9FUNG|nr:2-oxoacid dehydrogenases acyltransferase-domain-containing protein [Jimgerdemannia flammicorona]
MSLLLAWPSHKVVDMPALSPTMTQGNIGTWQKKVGDSIAPGDVLVEIETDKALMDFECQDEGYIAKILVESGTKDVSIGSVGISFGVVQMFLGVATTTLHPIVVFVDEQSDVAAFADFTVNDAGVGAAPAAPAAAKEEPKAEDPKAQPSEKKPEANQAASAPATASSDRVKASPVAKKVANERGISLDQITATGPGGRILKSDVESFTPSAAKPQPVAAAAGSKPAAAPAVGAYTDIPLSNMRKTIASRLSESNQIIPHYYLTVEVEMDKILKLREVLNKSSNDKYKLSVNDFVIKASALALKQVPEANSAWQGEFIRQYNNADVCVAVTTPAGLITPIVGAAEQKGLATISNQVKNLATRARDGKLLPHEYQGYVIR